MQAAALGYGWLLLCKCQHQTLIAKLELLSRPLPACRFALAGSTLLFVVCMHALLMVLVYVGQHLGDGFEDLIYFLLKVHVQEAVSLVQHQMLEQLQAEALHATTRCLQ